VFVDSHCHLGFPGLIEQYAKIRADMRAADVGAALCICTTLEEFDQVHALALADENFWASRQRGRARALGG
jgi:TatD DNase family protein